MHLASIEALVLRQAGKVVPSVNSIEHRSAGSTVMHDRASFVPARGVAYAAAIPVSFQNGFPQPPEVRPILPFERVAG